MQLIGEDVSGYFHFPATENLALNIPLTSTGPRCKCPESLNMVLSDGLAFFDITLKMLCTVM